MNGYKFNYGHLTHVAIFINILDHGSTVVLFKR